MGEKQILYLGLDPSRFKAEGKIVHHPIIKICPFPFFEVKWAFEKILYFTHIILSSRTALSIFFEYVQTSGISTDQLKEKSWIVVGKATESLLKQYGFSNPIVAKKESAEGIVDILETLSWKSYYIFYPHSSLARPSIVNFLRQKKIAFEELSLYETIPNPEFPDIELDSFDEVIFTSPSTVNAFLNKFGSFPSSIKATAIGPITGQALEKILVNF